MSKVTISEHKDGSFEVRYPVGSTQRVYPTFEWEKARDLLIQFCNISSVDGRKIYECWSHEGYYYFPTLLADLYYGFFIFVAGYKQIKEIITKNEYVVDNPHYEVVDKISLYNGIMRKPESLCSRWMYNFVAFSLRQLSSSGSVLLTHDGERCGAFRFDQIKQHVSLVNNFFTVVPTSFRRVLGFPVRRRRFYTGNKAWSYGSPPKFSYDECSFLHPHVSKSEFERLIFNIHRTCQDMIAETRTLSSYLAKKQFKVFFSADQTPMTSPLLVACRLNGIETIGLQIALITKYDPDWYAFGVPPEYCTLVYDKMIVWGDYWKNKLLAFSNKFSADNLEIGPHPGKKVDFLNFQQQSETSKNQIVILFPFELTADHRSISNFVREFLKLGFQVKVKKKPSETLENKEELAFDSDIRDKIDYIKELNAREIRDIDAVAFTQSSLAYDLMLYGKPLWFLETGNPIGAETVEDGLAYSIDETILKKMKDKSFLSTYLAPKYSLETVKTAFNDTNPLFFSQIVDKLCSD